MNNPIKKYGSYRHDLYLSELKDIFSEHLFVLDCSMLHPEPVNVVKTIETYLTTADYFETSNCTLKKVNYSKQPISRLHSILVTINILQRLIPNFLAVFIHWLRKRFVYVYK
jgi:hypothetical protein